MAWASGWKCTTYRPPTDHLFTVQLVHNYLFWVCIMKNREMTNWQEYLKKHVYNGRVEVKVIFTVVKQLIKQLQRKPRKNSEAWTGFEPMTSVIPVRCSTNWAMKPRWKQVKSEFNLYPLYEESKMMCIWYKSYIWSTVWCSTNWAMRPHWKQVKSELNLYPLYSMKRMRLCEWDGKVQRTRSFLKNLSLLQCSSETCEHKNKFWTPSELIQGWELVCPTGNSPSICTWVTENFTQVLGLSLLTVAFILLLLRRHWNTNSGQSYAFLLRLLTPRMPHSPLPGTEMQLCLHTHL